MSNEGVFNFTDISIYQSYDPEYSLEKCGCYSEPIISASKKSQISIEDSFLLLSMILLRDRFYPELVNDKLKMTI
jgi:hypothetical protein